MCLPRLTIDLKLQRFQRDLAEAAKKHPSVKDDLRETLDKLSEDDSFRLGDRIPGIPEHVRKIRVGVQQQNIGKSKGYRLIYLVDEEMRRITPLCFHFKASKALVPLADLARIIQQMFSDSGNAPPKDSPQVN
jgi:mRNA-degrading endonuclease RelE of RelBE toxin-antitoxin system